MRRSLRVRLNGQARPPERREESPAFNPPAAGEDRLDAERVDPMLLSEDPRRKRLDCVVVVDGHRGLRHDRTSIELRRDEVDGGARHFHPVLQCLALRFEAGKCRQE